MSQAVMRRRKVNMKASMWLPISAGVVGELAMAATEPTESERPKIRSASVSILARGRFSAASRCNRSCEGRSVFGLLAGCESGLGSMLLHGRPSVATCDAKVPKSIRRTSRQREASLVRLEKNFSFFLSPKAPYNFELTAKKPAGWDLFTPFEVFEEGTMWTALHVDGMLVGLKLKSTEETDSPRISVTAFLAHEPDDKGETIKGILAEKLGVNYELSQFYGFARRDPILKHAVDDLYGMRRLLGRYNRPQGRLSTRRLVGRRLREALLRERAQEREGRHRAGEEGGDQEVGEVELDGLLLRCARPGESLEEAQREAKAPMMGRPFDEN